MQMAQDLYQPLINLISTVMNNNINNKLRNVHNWLLAQQLSLNVSKTKLMMFHMPQKFPSLKLSICNLKIEEVDHFIFL